MSEAKHTEFAMQAIDLGELFRLFLGAEKLVGDTATYTVELAVPDGPSTAGGKQALQHIKLVPEGGGATLVMGSANRFEKTATLRTHEHVSDAYLQRTRDAFSVSQTAYDELSAKIEKFFGQQTIRVTTETFSPAAREETRAATRGGVGQAGSQKTALLVVVAVVLVAVGIFFLTRTPSAARDTGGGSPAGEAIPVNP